jgi:hypothetical protein
MVALRHGPTLRRVSIRHDPYTTSLDSTDHRCRASRRSRRKPTRNFDHMN